jgi:hypothetical protein
MPTASPGPDAGPPLQFFWPRARGSRFGAEVEIAVAFTRTACVNVRVVSWYLQVT